MNRNQLRFGSARQLLSELLCGFLPLPSQRAWLWLCPCRKILWTLGHGFLNKGFTLERSIDLETLNPLEHGLQTQWIRSMNAKRIWKYDPLKKLSRSVSRINFYFLSLWDGGLAHVSPGYWRGSGIRYRPEPSPYRRWKEMTPSQYDSQRPPRGQIRILIGVTRILKRGETTYNFKKSHRCTYEEKKSYKHQMAQAGWGERMVRNVSSMQGEWLRQWTGSGRGSL